MFRKLLVSFLPLTLFITFSYADKGDDSKDLKRLDKQAARFEDQAKQNGENQAVVFESLSKQLNVPLDVLQAQKDSTGFGFGQLFIANSLAQASGRSFDQITREFKSGKGWGVIAKENNVKLGHVVSGLKRADDDLKAERMRARDEQMRGNRGQEGNRGQGGMSRPDRPAPGSRGMGKGRH